MIPNPQSPIPNPQSAIPNPQSAIPHPQSPMPNPQSAIPNPQSPNGLDPAPVRFVTRLSTFVPNLLLLSSTSISLLTVPAV